MHVNVRFNGRLRWLVVRDLGPTVGSGRAAGKWCAAPTNTHRGPAPRSNISTFVAWGCVTAALHYRDPGTCGRGKKRQLAHSKG